MSNLKNNYLKKSINILMLLFVVVLMVSIGERYLWINKQKNYPVSLTTMVPATAQRMQELREVCGEPLELQKYDEQKVIIRCGIWWPMRKIWIVPGEYVEHVFPFFWRDK